MKLLHVDNHIVLLVGNIKDMVRGRHGVQMIMLDLQHCGQSGTDQYRAQINIILDDYAWYRNDKIVTKYLLPFGDLILLQISVIV